MHRERIDKARNRLGASRKQAFTAVDRDGCMFDARRSRMAQLHKVLQHGGGQIVHTEIPLLFKAAECK